MIQAFHKNIVRASGLRLSYLQFSTSKQELYIPVRPLKDERNLLFSIGAPIQITFSTKILAYTPFLATLLDGYINQWTSWGIAGTIVFYLVGSSYLRHTNFVKSHQIFELKTNKDLSRFYLTLPNNYYSQKYEQILLDHEKRSFQQMVKENIKSRTLSVPPKILESLTQATDAELSNHIAFLKSTRQEIVLEISKKDIDKFQLASESEVRKAVRQNIRRYLTNSQESVIFQGYSAIKQKRNFVLMTTKPFGKWNNRPLYFFMNLDSNIEKKYEEYIKALAEGKKIIDP